MITKNLYEGFVSVIEFIGYPTVDAVFQLLNFRKHLVNYSKNYLTFR